jgi:hypothetical protein
MMIGDVNERNAKEYGRKEGRSQRYKRYLRKEEDKKTMAIGITNERNGK